MKLSTRMVVLNSKKYVLDLIFAVIAAAYGLRRLYSLWTGAAIRVQRSLDDAKADIGFTANGDLDTVALLAFVGSGNGFVTTWYDQSGNGRHATQVTAANQPQIVSNGVIETINGKPTLFFGGSAWMVGNPLANEATSLAMSAVFQQQDVSNRQMFDWRSTTLETPLLDDGGKNGFGLRIRNIDSGAQSTEITPTNFNPNIYSGIWTGTNIDLRISGTSSSPKPYIRASLTLGTMGIGCNGLTVGSSPFIGTLSELVPFASALSTTDLQTLERNQGIYFNISVS